MEFSFQGGLLLLSWLIFIGNGWLVCLHDDDVFFLLFLGIIRHWGMTDTQCRAVDINGS